MKIIFSLFVFIPVIFPLAAVDFIPIQDGVFVHRSYMLINKVKVPSNGLIVKTDAGALLIDTAWDDDQTIEIVDWVEKTWQVKAIACIITHAHQDRLGGIRALRGRGIDVYASELTNTIARERGFGQGNKILPLNATLVIGGYVLVIEYFGHGHAVDNITVWFPERKIFFGGCLVKSLVSKNLGDLADADPASWKNVIERIRERYPDEITVIPGHGDWGGRALLERTAQLLERP